MKREEFLRQAGISVFGIIALKDNLLNTGRLKKSRTLRLFIGSYTSGPSEGITIGRLNRDDGRISLESVTRSIEQPSFLAYLKDKSCLYTVNEVGRFSGTEGGGISAYKYDPSVGTLRLLNSRPTLGADPCHLAVDRSGSFLAVANYSGGNVTVLPILPDGMLGEPVHTVRHEGKGTNPARQEKPHAHSVAYSPDNRFLFACDLGTDKIMIYGFDQQTGKLSPAVIPYFRTAPGAGPRHFTFAPDGKRAFVINELNSTITAMNYRVSDGVLTEYQTISTLPDDFTGDNTCADIHVHPSGRFVYGSNRGHDSIAVFRPDQKTGMLKPVQHQSTLGRTPRNFTIDPSGQFLLVANQNSGTVVALAINRKTGELRETGFSAGVPKPVCVAVIDD
jgi:6-phosphogluconolactonase